MKKANGKTSPLSTLLSFSSKISTGVLFLLFTFIGTWQMHAQNVTATGQVVDENQLPVAGATVLLKDNPQIGTSADEDGFFQLKLPKLPATLVVSFIGMKDQEIIYNGQKQLKVVLKENSTFLQEVVVVGYGQQKKESVVGAISQTKGEVLQRAGGVTSVGAALTGNLPGVTTVTGATTPGDEDPQIYIRGQGTWNNSSPLVLIDGIERSMSGLDVNSVQSISVLKDASATAVFGVKGANGVILITTKRGEEGKASIEASASTTIEFPSKLPEKYDSYDALKWRNQAIVNEVALNESSWADYTPYSELLKYRNQTSIAQKEQYPNIDWQDECLKDYCTTTNANINVSGGTPFVKYYASMDYVNENSIMKSRDNGKGYTPGYGYNRLNVRSNLDFNLTKTTKLSVNLAGYYSDKQDTWSDFEYRMWQAIYASAPDVYVPRYSDGAWGHYPKDEISSYNSIQAMSNTGIRNSRTTKINTDFVLDQNLNFVLDGLSAKATFSMDNSFISEGGIDDDDSNAYQKYIDKDGNEIIVTTTGKNNYDYVVDPWTITVDQVNDYATWRKMFYQFQLNYSHQFGNHNVSAMGLFSRDEYATGSEFPHYREDWVFRTTYDYKNRYFFEMNGSYNGSEKFGVNYRFEFFPSAAIGWMISDEPFMKWSKGFLNMMKFRASYGEVGDDSGSDRWLYLSQWSYGGNATIGSSTYETSPYTWYKESLIGNEDIHWEKVAKQNYGVDFDFFNGLLAGSLDVFYDTRSDILLNGSQRAVPNYFGGTPSTVNLGKVKVHGYELTLRSNYTLNNVHLWANLNFTYSKDKIIDADNPQLLADYQKSEGFQIGQPKSQIRDDFYNNWDEVYASTELKTYDNEKLPGNYNILDFNGDGVIDDYDSAPIGYPENPQNTYNWTIGADWNGWAVFLQFYAVKNASRYFYMNNWRSNMDVLYKQGTYWSKDNVDADTDLSRWYTHIGTDADRHIYDSSFLRLKTAEISYTWTKGWIKTIGLNSLKFYVNGNNLLFWSNLPDDRESSHNGTDGWGAYPTMKRINLGLKIKF